MIKNRKILLTGATGGVGKAIAERLYIAGANLFLISKSEDKLKKLKKSLIRTNSTGSIEYLSIDLRETDQLEAKTIEIIESLDGSLDVLINNAGIGHHGKIETVEVSELQEVFAVNVLAPILLTSRLLPLTAQSDGGHIVNISSILGSRSMPRTAVYTASKHALTGFSKTLRSEAALQGVCVTLIEPGAIETEFIRHTHNPEAKKFFSKRDLVKLNPEVIADWVAKVLESDSNTCSEVIQIMPKNQII